MTIKLKPRKSCPVCESQMIDLVYQLPFHNQSLKKFLADFYANRINPGLFETYHYQIKKCAACGFLFQANVLNQEGQSALYSEWVDNEKSLRKRQQGKAKLFRQYAGQIETVAQFFEEPPHQLKILEYGMGWGYWSRMANAFGYQVRGLEVSPERVEHARSLGVNTIQSMPEGGSNFDFIYANQVFEHLDYPLQALCELRDQLKPGGIIYLRVPDGRKVEAQLRSHGWSENLNAIHPLEHVNCFTRKTLKTLAKNAGLKPVQPPLRMDVKRLWGGLKREINDRWLTTHIYFKKQ